MFASRPDSTGGHPPRSHAVQPNCQCPPRLKELQSTMAVTAMPRNTTRLESVANLCAVLIVAALASANRVEIVDKRQGRAESVLTATVVANSEHWQDAMQQNRRMVLDVTDDVCDLVSHQYLIRAMDSGEISGTFKLERSDLDRSMGIDPDNVTHWTLTRSAGFLRNEYTHIWTDDLGYCRASYRLMTTLP